MRDRRGSDHPFPLEESLDPFVLVKSIHNVKQLLKQCVYQDKLNLVVCFKPMSGYENWASTKIVTQIKNGQKGHKNNHLAILLIGLV